MKLLHKLELITPQDRMMAQGQNKIFVTPVINNASRQTARFIYTLSAGRLHYR